jgi:hypothetical protein
MSDHSSDEHASSTSSFSSAAGDPHNQQIFIDQCFDDFGSIITSVKDIPKFHGTRLEQSAFKNGSLENDFVVNLVRLNIIPKLQQEKMVRVFIFSTNLIELISVVAGGCFLYSLL